MDEVVFTIGSRSYPLAKVTRDVPNTQVYITYGSFDPEAGTAVAYHRLSAPAEGLATLIDSHQSAYPGAELERDNGATAATVLEYNVADLERVGSPETFLFQAFEKGTIIGPGVVRGGKLHMRAITPGHVDLRQIQKVQEEGSKVNTWTGFHISRMGAYDPGLSVEAALAESLTPKQLEVIRAALALGYYDSPRRITLHHLSELYGISKAAAHNRLQAAERKIILTYFS